MFDASVFEWQGFTLIQALYSFGGWVPWVSNPFGTVAPSCQAAKLIADTVSALQDRWDPLHCVEGIARHCLTRRDYL